MRSEQGLNLPKAASSDMISFFFPQEKLNEGRLGLRKHHQNKYTVNFFSVGGTDDEGEIWMLGKLWLLQVLWVSKETLIIFWQWD